MYDDRVENALLTTIYGVEQLLWTLRDHPRNDRVALIAYLLAMVREEAYSGIRKPKGGSR